MGSITRFPPVEDPDVAWERYRTLAAATIDNPKLLLDRPHMEAQTRAYRRFAETAGAQ